VGFEEELIQEAVLWQRRNLRGRSPMLM
jgi:hypothetical protein